MEQGWIGAMLSHAERQARGTEAGVGVHHLELLSGFMPLAMVLSLLVTSRGLCHQQLSRLIVTLATSAAVTPVLLLRVPAL